MVNEQERNLVRRVLESKRLSSDQVDQLMAEGSRTGRSIREIAIGRGLLSAQDFQAQPPKQVATSTILFIFAGLMVFMGLALLTTRTFQARSQARDSLTKARVEGLAHKPNEALVDFTRYLETFPDDVDVRIERAGILEQLRRYDLAISDLRRAAELKPDRAAALEQHILELRRLSSPRPK